MNNERKVEQLKKWLDENKIPWSNKVVKDDDTHSDIRLTKVDVNVRIERNDKTDQEFYKRYQHRHPVFIRESETIEFIIEKVQNSIIDAMQRIHNARRKHQRKNEPKREKR